VDGDIVSPRVAIAEGAHSAAASTCSARPARRSPKSKRRLESRRRLLSSNRRCRRPAHLLPVTGSGHNGYPVREVCEARQEPGARKFNGSPSRASLERLVKPPTLRMLRTRELSERPFRGPARSHRAAPKRPRDAGPQPTSVADPVFATKALRKFLTCLTSRERLLLLDLGPVVGSNAPSLASSSGARFSSRISSRISIGTSATGTSWRRLPISENAFPQEAGSVDGILCWDLIDYLDRRAAQELANHLTRVLRPEGALLGFFGTARPRDTRYTKYIIVDEVNLKHRSYPAARGRQAILLNRDIIRLFSGLRVSDSFLLLNNLREILFRKPA
jgi:hypothetical protein